MSSTNRIRLKRGSEPGRAKSPVSFPLEVSIGAAIRGTHRSFTQQLEKYLTPYGIALGSWYFLRALWEQDGLTQHDLSMRIGMVDASAVQQLRKMEQAGLIVRRRSPDDRRKLHVYLTKEGRALRYELEPFAYAVNQHGLRGLSEGEIGFLRLVLARIRQNLSSPLPQSTDADAPVRQPRVRST